MYDAAPVWSYGRVFEAVLYQESGRIPKGNDVDHGIGIVAHILQHVNQPVRKEVPPVVPQELNDCSVLFCECAFGLSAFGLSEGDDEQGFAISDEFDFAVNSA